MKNNVRRTLYTLASLFAAFLFAVVVVAGATKWLPAGRGGVNHIVIPTLAFPAVWTVFALVLYAVRRRARAWAVVGVLTAVHVGLIVHGLVMRG